MAPILVLSPLVRNKRGEEVEVSPGGSLVGCLFETACSWCCVRKLTEKRKEKKR